MLHVRQVPCWKDMHACLAWVASSMQLCVTQSALSVDAAWNSTLGAGVVPRHSLEGGGNKHAHASAAKQASFLAVLSRFCGSLLQD